MTTHGVSRLVILATTMNRMIIIFWTIFLGGLSAAAIAIIDRDYWWLGGIFGILLGIGFGICLTSVFNLVIEFLAEIVKTQTEILGKLKEG